MGYTTYLLGAGASANAIPPVKQMNSRIWELLYLLQEFSNNNNIDNVKKYGYISFDYFQPFLDKIEKIITDITFHFSIDTYAKKLYLTKPADYNIIKHLINLYILFEQMSIEEIQNQLNIDYAIVKTKLIKKIGELKSNELDKYRESNLDERYDVLLASIYDKNLRMPKDLKIITYNYDNQLEIANGYYTNYKSIYTQYLSVQNEDNDEINIVKLNGFATFDRVKDIGKIEYDQNLNIIFSQEKILHQISKLYRVFNDQLTEPTNISFAWDESLYSSMAIDKAQRFILNSSNIVIIGYSFPEFNRKIDETILKYINNYAKIYLQTEETSYSILQDRLIQRANNINQNNIIRVNYIDQFFIP
ncbi:MAG: hypothetical protein IPO85_15740 [Saprospiraceae bacterium]|uniref:SIR2-like domain-containing protein n=1 Tax=Candidatus Defluviibacterium haderslevense TaxID=2981993 RepID=A0A9D7XFH7_9BACT|nr:hypothetical protein [Candidatus Defluviibacterium haderslevense]